MFILDTKWEGQCARLRFSTNTTPDYKGRENSPEKCRLKCGGLGFTHAGLTNGDECFCTDKFHFRLKLNNDGDDTCYRPCPGNTSHTCGGVANWANIYDTKGNPSHIMVNASPVSGPTTATHSSTTLTTTTSATDLDNPRPDDNPTTPTPPDEPGLDSKYIVVIVGCLVGLIILALLITFSLISLISS